MCDLGGASELANYGEYSGAPSESQTYEYAKTILKLMTEGPPRPDGKLAVSLFLSLLSKELLQLVLNNCFCQLSLQLKCTLSYVLFGCQ